MRAFLVISFVLCVSAISKPTESIEGSVTTVVDGDTLRVRPSKPLNHWASNPDLKIRMISIDAPEAHLSVEGGGTHSQGHWADEATKALTQMIGPKRRVHIESFGMDKYGRMLGKVKVQGEDVHLSLIRQGKVVTYFLCAHNDCPDNFLLIHQAETYYQACENARNQGLGIWNPTETLPELPFEFRLRVQNRKPERYVGHLHTKRLYQPDKYKEVPPCERIFFDDRSDAERLGFHF